MGQPNSPFEEDGEARTQGPLRVDLRGMSLSRHHSCGTTRRDVASSQRGCGPPNGTRQLECCIQMLDCWETPLRACLAAGKQLDDQPAVMLTRAFDFGRTSLRAMVVLTNQDAAFGVCLPTLCRPFYELASRLLWASREPNGWHRLAVVWMTERRIWAREAAKMPPTSDHASKILGDAERWLTVHDPDGALYKRRPSMESALRDVEKRDIEDGIKEDRTEGSDAAFQYTNAWRSMCRTAHAHISSIASSPGGHSRVAVTAAIIATFDLLRAVAVITAPQGERRERIESLVALVVKILEGHFDLGLHDLSFAVQEREDAATGRDQEQSAERHQNNDPAG